ncbi:SDR family oxidoreductase [Dyadobacter sp. CY326]|uniref:SDR family oxidoreductase n=1 Tax=Dyadobacter sp. CY326 TaxID=2907300 RepID=UPI001F37ACA2|nr:NAD(P)H-binding protein [Dyadobacter sp. CY326]MCE7066101.1 NAD(P)H-binding protein [Dyadobacter sp. CY326]
MSAFASPKILITGATGNIGKELTALLSSRNIPFRALVRSPDSGKEIAKLPGAELVVADFNDPATIISALAGIERAFLLTNSSELAEQQQRNVVSAANPPQALMDMLIAIGFPVWQAEGLVEDYAHYARGEAATVANDFRDLTGEAPRSFDQFAMDYAQAFK